MQKAISTDDSGLAVKAVGAGFLVLLISTLLARGIIALVASTSEPHVVFGATADVSRIHEFVAELPKIVERTEDTAFFVGPSIVFYGFSPKVFDAKMREHSIDLRTYNIGINANVPEVDDLIVRRIGHAYNQANRRVRVMMIAFGPWAFAEWFTRHPNRNRSKVFKAAALLTEAEIASLFLREPHYASEILGVRVLGGLGGPDVIALLGERMFGGLNNGIVSPSWWFGADPPAPDPYEQTVVEARRGWGSQLGRWDDSVRGEFFQSDGDDEATARLLAMAVKPAEKRLQWYRDTLKGDMQVRPELFALFLESVRFAQGFSDAVVVVVMPTNPLVGQLNAQGRRHYEELKAQIVQTGASLIDLYEPPGFTVADFLDFSHLNERTGKPMFSALLADRVVDVLAHQKR